jgi:primosomal protein N'
MDSVLPIYPNISIKDIETSKAGAVPEIHIVDQTISKIAKVQRQASDGKNKRKNKGIQQPEDDVDVRYFMENTIDIVTHKKLKLVSPELYSLIVHAEKLHEDVFIYTTRKGLSSSVVCSDCGHVLTCETCKKPFTLKNRKGVTAYECPNGHAPISLDSVCPICGSIHIQGLGSGTDALVAELKDVISMPIITIDGDSVTQAGVRNIFKKRKEIAHVPTIYIGTELAVHQSLDDKFTYSAIASLETLLALPSATSELEAARVVESLREKVTDTLVIQTRTPAHIVWSCVQEKKWNALTEQVQKDTEELDLPPYTTHIQLYISKAYKTSLSDADTIKEYIKTYPGISISHLQDEVRHILHIYIHEWPSAHTHQALYRYIKSLPKHIRVEVDSPSLM